MSTLKPGVNDSQNLDLDQSLDLTGHVWRTPRNGVCVKDTKGGVSTLETAVNT